MCRTTRRWSGFRPASSRRRASRPQARRFAAYAVVQNQDDPYAKAIQGLVAHSHELEDAVAVLSRKLSELERELAEHEAQTAPTENLRAVK